MNRWSAHTMFASIGPGTDMLIFEVTIAGRRVNQISIGDELRIMLGAPKNEEVTTSVVDAADDAVIFAVSDGRKWRMTPRRPDEPQTGIIWTASPSTEWVVRSEA
jgi:hypothetical protein